MTYPSLIQEALTRYAQKKHIFGKENPFISELKQLPQRDRANNFELFKCFIKNDNGFSCSNASFEVLIAFIEHVLTTSFNDDRILLELLHYYKSSDIKIVFGLTAPSHNDSNTIHVYWDEYAQQIKYFITFDHKRLINADVWDERKVTNGHLDKNDLLDDYSSIVNKLKTELVVRQHHLKQIGQEQNKDIVPFFDAVTFDVYPEADTPQLFSVFRALVKKGHIKCHDHDPYKLLAILKFCFSNRFINKDNFNSVFIRIFEYCRTQQCGDDTLSILTYLHKAKLLTADNFNKVISNELSECSDYIRWTIAGFFNGNELSQCNLDAIFQYKRAVESVHNALQKFYSHSRWSASSQHIRVTLTKLVFDELRAISIFNLDAILDVFALRLKVQQGIVIERYDTAKSRQFNDTVIAYMLDAFKPLISAHCFTSANIAILKDVDSPKQFAELISLSFNAGCSIKKTVFLGSFNIDDSLAACRMLNAAKILTQINLDALLCAPRQVVLADALIALHSANILTDRNRVTLLNASDLVPRLKRLYNKGILTQENLDALLNATSPDRFVDVLEILQEANCLTQQNRADFLTFTGSASPFISLYKKGIFTQENLDALRIAKSPDDFVRILEALHYSQCLTPKNREKFLAFTDKANLLTPTRSINPFITLYKKSLLTQENLDALLISTSPRNFADILEILNEAKCLNQQNRIAFLNFRGSIDTLRKFYDTGLLKQKNLDAFLKAKHPEKFVKILELLKKSGCLTQQNRIAFLNFDGPIESIEKLCSNNLLTQENLDLFLITTSPVEFTDALVCLQSARLVLPENKTNFLDFLNVPNALEILNKLRLENGLTAENLDAVISCVHPNKFIELLLILMRANYLSPQNRVALQTFQGEKNAFQALHAARILTQANIVALFDRRNGYLSSQEATRIVWDRLPIRLLTQTVFDQLIVHAQVANAQNSIRSYVTQVLAPPPRPHRAQRSAGAIGIFGNQAVPRSSNNLSVGPYAQKLSELNFSEELIPEEYRCPLSLSIMSDPVYLQNDQTANRFERSWISHWLTTNNTHPTTRKRFELGALRSDPELRIKIDEFVKNAESSRATSSLQSKSV